MRQSSLELLGAISLSVLPAAIGYQTLEMILYNRISDMLLPLKMVALLGLLVFILQAVKSIRRFKKDEALSSLIPIVTTALSAYWLFITVTFVLSIDIPVETSTVPATFKTAAAVGALICIWVGLMIFRKILEMEDLVDGLKQMVE